MPQAQSQIEERASATRTAPGDGSQHDTNKLDEAKDIIRDLIGQSESVKDERFIRAHAFLKENGE
jgi:hypothetical protein